MVFYIIGIGLSEGDITLKGLDAIKKSQKVYLENYTSIPSYTKEKLETLTGKEIILADRELVENSPDDMLLSAKTKDVSFLVPGDPFGATTHSDLCLRAFKAGIKTIVVHGISILTAVGDVGLSLYKFGQTSSIVFPEKDWMPETPYNVIKQNKQIGLHTLLLLDIKVKEPLKEDILKGKKKFCSPRYMSVNKGINYLLDIEQEKNEGVFTRDTLCIACARLGTNSSKIAYGKAFVLADMDFGEPLHCIIVPGNLHFMEQELLKQWEKEK